MKNQLKFFLALIIIALSVADAHSYMYWNRAAHLLGNQTSYMRVDHSPTVDITGSFTMEAWINPANTTPKGVMSKGGTLGTSLRIGMRITSSRIVLITNGFSRLSSRVSNPIPVNTWTHVCGTYDSASGRFDVYINGVLDSSSVIAGAFPTSNTDSLFVGISGASTPFNGQMDEVRLWNRALTSDEVSKYFRTSLGNSTGRYIGLVMSLAFQKVEGTAPVFNKRDVSGNNNHADLRNVSEVDLSERPLQTISHNECVEFDGNGDYLQGPDAPLLNDFFDVFTIECWVYLKRGGLATIVAKPNQGMTFDYRMFLNAQTQLTVNIGSATFNGGAAATVPINEWTHVAFSQSIPHGYFFLDGKIVTVDSGSTVSIPDGSGSLYVGGAPGSPSLEGFIDELRLTETAITSPLAVSDKIFISRDKSNDPSALTELSFNFDGNLNENTEDPNYSLSFVGDSKFSHVCAEENKPMSPLLRADSKNFTKGFYTKCSSKRVPSSGTSGSVLDSLPIGKNVAISDVNLFIALNHTELTNLELTLISPSGDSCVVFNGRSTNSANDNLVTIFDDQADSSLNDGRYTEFGPRIKPSSNLNSSMNGNSAAGFWKLRITDQNSADTGRLIAWGIQINNMPQREINMLVSFAIQGFYDAPTNLMRGDTAYAGIKIFNYSDTSKGYFYPNGTGLFSLTYEPGLGDFIVSLFIRHRNTIETLASTYVYPVFGDYIYDFRPDESRALGDNMIPIDLSPLRYAFYSGDVNQDGSVDATDLALIDNDAANFVGGYIATDITGDDAVDATDAAIADNNAANFVGAITP